MESWGALERKHLTELLSPGQVEMHLERIRSSGFSRRRGAKMKDREWKEDFLRSFETVRMIRNPK